MQLLEIWKRYTDKYPSRKITFRLGLGFRSRLGLVLGLGGGATRQLPRRQIDPWLGLEAIVLETIKTKLFCYLAK